MVTVNIPVPCSVIPVLVHPAQLLHLHSLVLAAKLLPLDVALNKEKMRAVVVSSVVDHYLAVVTTVSRYVMKVYVNLVVFFLRRNVSVDDVKRVCDVGKSSLRVKSIQEACFLVRCSA